MSNDATITDGPIQVVVEVPDREGLVTLLETISETVADAHTESIASGRLTEESSVTVDLNVLTDKQREALTLALESGYYSRPRDVTLSDLSEQLDITKSAVSQRLRSAEIKLIENAMERYR